MNGFAKLQERLRKEGWYVEWALPCCQSCAWGEVPFVHEFGPFKGEEIDLDKVLFNHEQDCECEPENPYDIETEEDKYDEWWDQYEEAEENETLPEFLGDSWHEGSVQTDTMITWPHTIQSSSMFCFSGSKEGVENLKAILPIIEECDCEWHWTQKGDARIEISWKNME